MKALRVSFPRGKWPELARKCCAAGNEGQIGRLAYHLIYGDIGNSQDGDCGSNWADFPCAGVPPRPTIERRLIRTGEEFVCERSIVRADTARAQSCELCCSRRGACCATDCRARSGASRYGRGKAASWSRSTGDRIARHGCRQGRAVRARELRRLRQIFGDFARAAGRAWEQYTGQVQAGERAHSLRVLRGARRQVSLIFASRECHRRERQRAGSHNEQQAETNHRLEQTESLVTTIH